MKYNKYYLYNYKQILYGNIKIGKLVFRVKRLNTEPGMVVHSDEQHSGNRIIM